MRKLAILAALALAALGVFAQASYAETEAPTTPTNTTGEVTDEDTLTHCGEVTKVDHHIEGGCIVHAVGGHTVMSRHTIFGEEPVAVCSNEFTAHIGTTASGTIEGWIPLGNIKVGHEAVGGTTNCGEDTGEGAGIDNCSEQHAQEEGHPGDGDWHIEGVEDGSDGSLWLEVNLCLENVPGAATTENPNAVVHGHLWVRVTENANEHVTSLEAEDHRLLNPLGGQPHGLPSGVDAEFNGHWTIESADRLIVTH